jgi:hypothetical protein
MDQSVVHNKRRTTVQCNVCTGLHDNVGSCFRNISPSNTLPDTLQAINLSCSPPMGVGHWCEPDKAIDWMSVGPEVDPLTDEGLGTMVALATTVPPLCPTHDLLLSFADTALSG